MIWPDLYRRAYADALALQQHEEKLRVILGMTELPAWVGEEMARLRETPTIPANDDGPGRFLRTATAGEAAELVYAGVIAGDLPGRCVCEGHEHRPDVYEPAVCLACRCWGGR